MTNETETRHDQAPREGSGLGSFPSSFWVANVMELFERGAYYGLNAVLAVYLSNKVADGGLGFTEDMVGLLQSFVYAATYVIPILGGALADRYGYRKMLLVAFSLLAAGYFLSGNVTSYGVIFATLLIMATGSGLFKPIVSGTIARTTTEKNSGMGFGIYYWMINLGALIAPLVAGYLRDSFSWRWVFFVSALYCAAMLIPTAFFYRDPPKPESTKKVKEVLGNALIVLSDARFMLLIFVYSCFWILYFQNFGSILWYLGDFINKTPVNNFFAKVPIFGWIGVTKLGPEHVTVVNAGTIVVLQVVVNFIVKRFKPLPTMIGGILIGSVGFLCLAASQNAWILILGIVIFSIGEMTCHPKYYSYIGIVAPQESKATYMGYAFLYGVIGSLVGSNVGGEMYYRFLAPLKGKTGISSNLRNFWLVFAVLGVITTLLLAVYNRIFGEDTPDTRRKARRVMIFIYGFILILSIGMLFFVYYTPQRVVPFEVQENPAGHTVTALMETIERGDDEAARTFIGRYMDEEYRQAAPIEEHLSKLRVLYGAVETSKIDTSDEHSAGLIVFARETSRSFRIAIELDPDSPHQIVALDVSKVPRIPAKTWVQSVIMFLIGIGGLYTLLRRPHPEGNQQ